MDRRINRPIDKWADRQTCLSSILQMTIAEKIIKLRSVKMVDWTVKQTYGQMDRRLNRPIDKWADRQTCLSLILQMTIADKIKKLKSIKMVGLFIDQT